MVGRVVLGRGPVGVVIRMLVLKPPEVNLCIVELKFSLYDCVHITVRKVGVDEVHVDVLRDVVACVVHGRFRARPRSRHVC